MKKLLSVVAAVAVALLPITPAIAQNVNQLILSPSATGVPPQLGAGGTDSNISITIAPKGTGATNLQGLITSTPASGQSSPTLAGTGGSLATQTPAVVGSDSAMAAFFGAAVTGQTLAVNFSRTLSAAPNCVASTNYAGAYIDYVTSSTTQVIVKVGSPTLPVPWTKVTILCFDTTAR